MLRDFRMIRLDVIGVKLQSAGVTDHCEFGIADSDLTDAEVEATIETSPLDDLYPENTNAQRPVFPIGSIHAPVISQTGLYNNGMISEHTIRWTFKENHGWQWYAYNLDNNEAMAASDLNIHVKIYGVWLR